MSVSVIAAQFTGTNGPSLLALRSWIVRAATSFPVPLSPSNNTVEFVRATFSSAVITGCITGSPYESGGTA